MNDTHPYITYDFDTSKLSARTWLLIGEAMSKCQHLAGVPLKPELARLLSSVYLARGAQATTAIEGNTLTEDEVKQIVDKGSVDVPESREYLQRELQNVLAAWREVDESIREHRRIPITVERLEHLNFMILEGIPDKPEVVPGAFREHNVGAGTYRAIDWQDVRPATKRLVEWLDQMAERRPEATVEERFTSALLRAILAHLYIAWIHPFGNGNGRLARMVELQILSESGVVPLVSNGLLSDHYNKTRSAYYLALDAAQHDVRAFVAYAIEGFVDELRDQIAYLREESLRVHWESYVYEIFDQHPNTAARKRQRALALALPATDEEAVTPERATRLNTQLAHDYALAGDRMPARDLNDLVRMELAVKVDRRTYRARREVIKAFIPDTY